MILTCPECSTRYVAKQSAIGPNGRTVRCAKCSNAWFVPSPEIELSTPEDLQLQDIERDASESVDSLLSSGPKDKAGNFGGTPIFSEHNVPDPDIQGASLPMRGADALLRDKIEAGKRRARRRVIFMIWLIPLLFILGLCVVLFVSREAIAERFPASVPFYNAMNIDVSQSGLRVENPIINIPERNNGPVIEVTGKVKNISQEAKPLPPLIFTLHNPAGEEIARWEYEFDQAVLAAYAEVSYKTEYVNPPPDSVDLQYRLANKR